jgi:hypothetical protein
VELDIRASKQTLKMDILSCKTPEMVRQEVWMHLLAYNLTRKVLAQASLPAGLWYLQGAIDLNHRESRRKPPLTIGQQMIGGVVQVGGLMSSVTLPWAVPPSCRPEQSCQARSAVTSSLLSRPPHPCGCGV